MILRLVHKEGSFQEIVVSITVGAAALFALIGGYLTNVFGRRPVIFLASFVFTLGSVLLGAAQNRAMLVVGRFIVGAGIGKSQTWVQTLGRVCVSFRPRLNDRPDVHC